MARFIRLLILATLVYSQLVFGVPGKGSVTQTHEHQMSTQAITNLMRHEHYKDIILDDDLSARILERYLESLDPNHSIFLASDIAEFQAYRKTLDESIKRADVSAAFTIFERYKSRMNNRIQFVEALLRKPFDFTVDENYLFDRSELPWPADLAESNDIWRKRVKNEVLNLKLANKKPAEIVETLSKRYQTTKRQFSQWQTEDIYQLFMNAYTYSIEPHTSYFSPRTNENFNINMRLSLEGIGAALGTLNEYTQIQRIIPGGPAERSGKLHPEDRILGVAQGTDGEMVDVVGWRLGDVVDLIRGDKGSVVRLQVLGKGAAPDSQPREISLVRDKIKLEDQAASHYIIETQDVIGKLKIGVIDLPSFYIDFEARSRGQSNYRSTTRDVRALLEKLKQEKIDGLVVDLRGNGGGSLDEAVILAGLFIKSGPIVQIQNNRGYVDIKRDPDPNIAYTGPLAVLVDNNSASASEIFAGAIKDYRRGLVIGQPTFGKGTVQSIVDLNFTIPQSKGQFGSLKITTAQFFRINGESTQYRGVVPDLKFSVFDTEAEHGERSLDNALPWAKIQPAHFNVQHLQSSQFEQLYRSHLERTAKNPGFRFLQSQVDMNKEMENLKYISLLESRRSEERKQREKVSRELENQFREARNLPLLTESDETQQDEDADQTSISEDLNRVLVEETANILSDFIRNERRQTMANMPHTEAADSGLAN